jgi:hypothetical protein
LYRISPLHGGMLRYPQRGQSFFKLLRQSAAPEGTPLDAEPENQGSWEELSPPQGLFQYRF